jgi:hypothetical protein
MRKLLRPVAVVAAGLISATMIPSPAGAAAVDDGANWLTRQLTDNVVVGEYRDTFTHPDNPIWVEYTDQGLTADVAIALDTIGGRPVKVTRIGEALAPEIDAWTGAGDYANSVAKAAVTATITGQDPTSYGGNDLVAQLEARTADAATIAGRLEDGGGGTDYANTIGQAFAALALDLAGSPEADAARAFLLDQQCADGSFRLGFSAKDAVDQSCDADPGSVPDTDATALSVILLSEVATDDPAVDSAITSAVSWLKATQRESGAFGGGTSTEAANANSTGLAAWALGDQGSCARAEKAADWVRTLQVRGSVKGTPLAGEEGAIAYDKAAYRVAKDTGIKRAARDQWRRASVQAAPGLRFVAGC